MMRALFFFEGSEHHLKAINLPLYESFQPHSKSKQKTLYYM